MEKLSLDDVKTLTAGYAVPTIIPQSVVQDDARLKLVIATKFSAAGTCVGSSDMCAYVGVRGEAACHNQRGCSWNGQSRTCGGIEFSCRQMTDQNSCDGLRGCHWTWNPAQKLFRL